MRSDCFKLFDPDGREEWRFLCRSSTLLFSSSPPETSSAIRRTRVHRRQKFKADMRRPQGYAGGAKHKCAVCGRTELDDPTLEFRFCSKCEGNYGLSGSVIAITSAYSDELESMKKKKVILRLRQPAEKKYHLFVSFRSRNLLAHPSVHSYWKKVRRRS